MMTSHPRNSDREIILLCISNFLQTIEWTMAAKSVEFQAVMKVSSSVEEENSIENLWCMTYASSDKCPSHSKKWCANFQHADFETQDAAQSKSLNSWYHWSYSCWIIFLNFDDWQILVKNFLRYYRSGISDMQHIILQSVRETFSWPVFSSNFNKFDNFFFIMRGGTDLIAFWGREGTWGKKKQTTNTNKKSSKKVIWEKIVK